MEHPFIFSYLQTKNGFFKTREYEIHQERQRPTFAKLLLDEPIEKGILAGLDLVYNQNRRPLTIVEIISCSKRAEESYEVKALEISHKLLKADFGEQLAVVNSTTCLQKIASQFGLKLQVEGTLDSKYRTSPMFMGSVRNALDQVWQIFELDEARWLINPLTKTLKILASGQFLTKGQAIDRYFIKEQDGGIETKIIPMLRPYTPILYQDEEKVVDIVRLNSKTNSSFITFAEEVA